MFKKVSLATESEIKANNISAFKFLNVKEADEIARKLNHHFPGSRPKRMIDGSVVVICRSVIGGENLVLISYEE